MKKMTFLLTLFLTFPTWALDGSTGSGHFDFRQKAERKQDNRWTLQEWLAQKDRNRMMDLWLAMYSPSPYEYFVGGAYQDFTTKDEAAGTTDRHENGIVTVGAYATVIGIEGFYENNIQEQISQSGGSLNLRVLGNAVQGTHLSINYGYRSMKTELAGQGTTVNQPFAGADLNMYLTRYFGISGMYRSYVAVENDVLGTVSGHRTEAGLFVDFSALRVFGSWYSDVEITQPQQQTESKVIRSGVMSGIKFFF
ncbi:MAG: hypothetical protein COT73_12145 [Bdellovibrio sp. CG10_big_fil_rev_8_21_14_0_10_47_8]|nr:MAG: hypothetical protein COT73_12145 [Bdellovibrio sp. CG10_big_fil_rev_8_21_14_0_10_47_8]